MDLGETYDESAIKELREETGLDAEVGDLILLRTEIRKSFDEVTRMTNHPRRNIYLLKNKVITKNLAVENGKAIGFVSYPLATLFNLDESERAKFIPTLLDEEGLSLFKEIEKNI